jgi:hypothetical protein
LTANLSLCVVDIDPAESITYDRSGKGIFCRGKGFSMGWFRQLKQRLRNRIYGVPDYRPQIIEGMTKLYDTLGDHPIKDRLWVNGGVLLGYVREGGLLRHDTDADLSVWEEDVPDLVSLFPRL